MKNSELIQAAASAIRVRKTKGGLIGDVGCALISEIGQIFTGICAASGSNVSCAEQNAIGAMITAGEYRIVKIVAVWKDEQGAVFVIAPCGNCRQFMYEIAHENLKTEVILDAEKTVTLEELLPFHSWWKKQ